MKIVLPVSEVPVNSIVTKVQGSKEYIVRDEIKIYNNFSDDDDGGAKKQTIKTSVFSNLATTVRFLVPVDGGDISAVPSNLEVMWDVDEDELYSFLQERDADNQI